MRSSSSEITAVDLFCGVGGLTHGLRRGGINVAAGIDIDAECAHAYEANNGASFIQQDVATLDVVSVKRLLGLSRFTLLAGCAPCQPFSTYSRSGRGRQHAKEWPLLLDFGQLVQDVQPDLVTMENVPQILDDEVFDGFLERLSGYHTSWSIVECAAYGIPQTRKRLVLFASKLGCEPITLTAPDGPPASVKDVIGDLPAIEAGERSRNDPLHVASKLSTLNLARIRASVPGGTWRDWPTSLLADCHRRSTGATYPSVYGRMRWDRPAPTITTQCFGYGNGRFGHPEQDRAISLREAAMLQTFPQDYSFVPPGGTIRFNRLGRMIGNAVPVRLGELIAQALVRHVDGAVCSPRPGAAVTSNL